MDLGFLLGQPAAENVAAKHFVPLDLWGRVTLFSRLAVSLVGEELITACFLFPVLWWALKHYQPKTACLDHRDAGFFIGLWDDAL